jgi:hypothetical protein
VAALTLRSRAATNQRISLSPERQPAPGSCFVGGVARARAGGGAGAGGWRRREVAAQRRERLDGASLGHVRRRYLVQLPWSES